MHILVLNVGSSSVKFQLVDTDGEAIAERRDRRLAKGQIDRIGGEAIVTAEGEGRPSSKVTARIRDHAAAAEYVVGWLTRPEFGTPITSIQAIQAVGHRVVHGGARFNHSTRIDDEVWHGIEDLIDLAPLHNPANLRGIAAVRTVLGPDVPQVAVFDTAFHQSIAETAFVYAIPYQYYRQHGVRRYGFHGTSHRYVAYRYRELTGRSREATKIITLHLGNGASACAISSGQSADTSMGFTPLEGLVMGTRSGDLDPAIVEFIAAKEGMNPREVDSMLNKQSGLLGISGLSGNMRDLLFEEGENADRRARLAIDVFCYRVKKYIGAYLAALNGADAIVFAGGIGEHAPDVRRRICAGLDALGIVVDETKNAGLVGQEGRFDGAGLAWSCG